MDRAFRILLSLQRGTSRHGQWVVECLKGAWNRLVGEKLATVCRPVHLKGSVLEIEVIDDAWIDTVRNMQPELLDKLSAVTGAEVNRLRIIKRS
jgi:predicted nucleic acid-binding Zn ribbon protein